MTDITIHYKNKDVHFNQVPKDVKKAIEKLLHSMEDENYMFSDEQFKESK